MLKKILAGLATAVLSLGVVAVVASPAAAHHNTITPSVVCHTDGTYKVIWKVRNSESNKTEVIVESNMPSVVPVGTQFGFSEEKTFTQYVTEPQNLELVLKGSWPGGVYSTDRGSISKGSFPTGCITVKPEAWETPSECTGPGTYSEPSYGMKPVTGIKYKVNGVEKPADTYPATNGSTVTITAEVTDPKYKIEGKSSWTFTFAKPADGTCVGKVEPKKPDIEQQVCTAPGQHKLARFYVANVTGVIYTRLEGGTETVLDQGQWYDVPDGVKIVTVIARPDTANHYVFKDGTSSKTYELEFPIEAGDCLVEVKPKDPKVTTGTCDVQNHPGVVPTQSFTLVYVPNVVYQVSTDGGVNFTDTVITQNTTQNVAPGTKLVVTAKPSDPSKYTTPALWKFEFEFGDPGDCKGIITPLAPSWSPGFCDDSVDPRILVSPSVRFTPVAGLTYYVDGAEVTGLTPGVETVIELAAGPHSLNVTLNEPSKYKLDTSVDLPFEETVHDGECLPTHPLLIPLVASHQIGCFTAGSYTLRNDLDDDDAVIWEVNGSRVAPDTYTITGTGVVTITATPNAPDYGFVDGVQTSWTIDFRKPSVCDLETLALTGQNPTGMLLAADGLVVAGLAMFALRSVRRRTETA